MQVGFRTDWQDFDAPDSASLYYWLESVDLNGNTSRYGPVSVEPVAPTAVGLDSFAGAADGTRLAIVADRDSPLWRGPL